MKILYVVTQGEMGGAQKYVLDLAQVFKAAIACGAEKPELLKKAQDAGLPTYSLRYLKRSINPVFDLRAVWELRKLIKIIHPDIVHLNSSKAGVIGAFAAIGTKTKVVYTAHGFVFNEPLPFFVKWMYLMMERVASWFRGFTITVSQKDFDSGSKHGALKKNYAKVIYNGIKKIDFLHAEIAREKLNLDKNKIIIGTIGHFYPNKGFDVLVDAASKLPIDKIQVVIIGDGTERSNLQSQISNLKLSHVVKLPGQVEGASRYLKGFDIFVLPSRKEGFPWTLLEALHAGLPIITTDVGGNREAIGDAGVLIKSEDATQLADALMKLVDDETKETLGEKAYTRSREFTFEKMIQETTKVYSSLI